MAYLEEYIGPIPHVENKGCVTLVTTVVGIGVGSIWGIAGAIAGGVLGLGFGLTAESSSKRYSIDSLLYSEEKGLSNYLKKAESNAISTLQYAKEKLADYKNSLVNFINYEKGKANRNGDNKNSAKLENMLDQEGSNDGSQASPEYLSIEFSSYASNPQSEGNSSEDATTCQETSSGSSQGGSDGNSANGGDGGSGE